MDEVSIITLKHLNKELTAEYGQFHRYPKAVKAGIKSLEAWEAVKDEIAGTDFDFGDYYDNTETIQKMVLEIIDKHLQGVKQ